MEAEVKEAPVQSEPSTSEDYDALYDQVMGVSEETAEPSQATESENTEGGDPGVNSEAKNTDNLFTLKHQAFENGERQFDKEKVTEYAQKGFDYETKMREIKAQKSEFEEQKKAYEEQFETFKQEREYWSEIDQYMSDNPRFAQIVQEQWAREKGSNYTPPSPEVQALNKTIEELKGRLDSQDKERMERSTQRAQESLEKSIAGYKESKNFLDWESKDEFGNSLQDRIEEFAVKKEIKSFSDAANLLLHDQLLKHTALKAKEDAAKELQKQKKLGLGPVTDSPQNKGSVSGYRGSQSYSDLASEALQELGIN